MRITNAIVTRDTINRLSMNSAKLAEAQQRVSSGLKVQKVSDDPIAGTRIMQTSSMLRGITQFRRNVQSVGAELDSEDSTLTQVGDVLTRAKELAVSESGANANATTRLAAAAEVQGLINQVVQFGNTKSGDGFLFGGANSVSSPPFDQNQTATAPAYVSIPAGQTTPLLPQGNRPVEIATAQSVPGVHDGNTVFVQSGVLSSLQSLYNALAGNSPSGIAASETNLDNAFGNVQALVGDVGARRNQVDAAGASLDALDATLKTQQSDLSEVDMESAITEMVARQTAYQAAMMASSKVMGMSLTDYLR